MEKLFFMMRTLLIVLVRKFWPRGCGERGYVGLCLQEKNATDRNGFWQVPAWAQNGYVFFSNMFDVFRATVSAFPPLTEAGKHDCSRA